MYARHLPTERFTRDEFNAMPQYPADYDGFIEGPAFARFPDRAGKTVVSFCPAWPGDDVGYLVRPIVRVPYGREVV